MVPPPASAEAAFATYTRNTTAGMRAEELKMLLGDLGLLQVGAAGCTGMDGAEHLCFLCCDAC